jgi:hypothetical protein
MMPPLRGRQDVLGYRKLNLSQVLRLQHTRKAPTRGLAGALSGPRSRKDLDKAIMLRCDAR